MDIDGFIRTHSDEWARLRELLNRAGRSPKNLSSEELEELAALYQRVSTHLSMARTSLHDRALVAELSQLVARASALLYGTRGGSWKTFGRFVTETFPAALWHTRAFHVWAALLLLVPGALVAAWLGNSPAALEATAPPAVRDAYVTEDFAEYYTASPSAQFATEVTVNNIQVAILAFAGGGLLALPTVFVLVFNGLNVGVALGMFIAAGEQARFWGLIVPHGLLELTAVFLAGGSGLRVGWTLIDPGDRRRAAALREEGRRVVALLAGLVAVFVTAGLIEGFVTGAPLPTWVRVAIGVAAQAIFMAYVVVLGRRATARGLTGAIGEGADRGWASAPARAPEPSPA